MKTPAITVSNLTVKSNQRTLLEDVSLQIAAGEITLLVGRSGSGKTIFMKLLAGLISPNNPYFTISGSIRVENQEILSWSPWGRKKTPIGIVFQDYGLMDNYSIWQNLDFAFCHSPFPVPPEQRQNVGNRLAQKLELDYTLAIRHASGGQKRRIAIARTLAYNPEMIIYDEPTAGLDPQMTKKVAQLIHDTHQLFGKKSTIVVTHQYEDFLPFAQKILFLDPVAKTIRAVTPAELTIAIQKEEPAALPEPARYPRLRQITHHVATFFANTASFCGCFLAAFFLSLWRLIPVWRSPVWGIRFLGHFMRQVSFLSSLIYIGMAGLIVGFVGSYFTFKFLPYGHYTKPLITEEVLGALGYGFYRIIIPIFTSVLVAARCGASVTSDIGNRVYLQEIDAMRSLGASPSAYLQTAINYAFLLGLPFLTMIAFFLARAVSLWVFLLMHPQHNAIFADAIFHGFLRQGGTMMLNGTSWVIAKELVCGFGLANICYFIGMRPKSSTRDISRDITLAVIWGTIFVLTTHLVFALLEF